MSDLIIGLTVVALGTSTPELTISLMAALDGNAALAVGNVVGSNICNILLIIGVTAMIRPIPVERSIMTNEIPMVILASLLVLFMGNSTFLDGTANMVTRVEGLFLLVFFLLFMRYTFAQARQIKPSDSDPVEENVPEKPLKLWLAVVYIVGGLAALVWGGDRFVEGASGIARSLGVSDALIGLTIVAVGTSLPELAASAVAAYKGKPGIAIGNVIGSNIFNILLILGASAVVSPLPFGGVTAIDLDVLVASAILFWVFGWFFGQRKITRVEGAVMFLVYAGYTAFLVATA